MKSAGNLAGGSVIRTTKLLGLLALLALQQCFPVDAAEPALAFPGALGWAAHTTGGRGGKILRVINLKARGPGSLREALEASGPRTVVFEVAGLIDLDRDAIDIKEPFLTIAGQTAPSPGITLIRGGIDVRTHDVVIRHIRIRPGDAEVAHFGGWERDGFSTYEGAYNVIVDHCSLTWATDENLSSSGKRFIGDTPEDWRKNTSHSITFSNNLIGEGLAFASHAKGEHSKGSLIHDNITDILIIGNLYAHNLERSPLFKGGVRGMVINNLIYDPGQRAIHYNLIAEEWGEHPYQTGRLTMIGNAMRAGPSTPNDVALFMLGGSGDIELYQQDNIAVDRIGRPLPMLGRYTTSAAKIIELTQRPVLPEGVKPLSAAQVQDAVINDVGARPWDRDHDDARIVADTIEGRGRIIDSQTDVGGYPHPNETHQPFNPDEWDLDTMTLKKPLPPRHRPT
jgi:pectate lyase